jgi:hypothetical protein
MTNKLIWAALCLALASGCAGTPRWDDTVFPNQVYYDMGDVPSKTVAEQKK